MGDWTHSICIDCWFGIRSDNPVTLFRPKKEECCFCGATTQDGIYIRYDPKRLTCQGIHEEDKKK